MNKILREEMEYLITCDDKTITPDVRDDVSLTLQYIDELENKIDKAIEYINNNKNKLYQGRNDFTCEIQYSDEVVKANELLDILRGEDNEDR